MRRKSAISACVCFFLLFLATTAFAFRCSVAKVIDGDTFRCIPDDVREADGARVYDDGTVAVRLSGIDAPERSQAYGQEAKRALAAMVENKVVEIEARGIDRYKRIVAYVWVDGKNANLELVANGFAWAYTKYLDRPYLSEFHEAEKEARTQRLGLWAQANPTPPWEYRKNRR